MLFATVRWGLPNVAAIVALAALPMLSSVTPNDKQMASAKFESADLEKPTPALRIAFAE